MGGGASKGTNEFKTSFAAFLEAKNEYETAVGQAEEVSAEELFSRVWNTYITADGRKKTQTSTDIVTLGRRGEESDHMMSSNLLNEEIVIRIGDVVKVKDKSMNTVFYFEGVVLKIEEGKALVNFGDDVVTDDPEDIEKEFPLEDCVLTMSGLELEEGDHVEVKCHGNLYCRGFIVNIHRKFINVQTPIEVTYDVEMETDAGSDDQDHEVHEPDMEYNVPPSHIRKVISNRISAAERWKRGFLKLQAASAFKKSGAERFRRLSFEAMEKNQEPKETVEEPRRPDQTR